MIKIGVPKETYPDERRVALVPSSIAPLAKIGVELCIEAGAGTAAGHEDAEYIEKGASVAADRATLFQEANIIVQVRGLGANPQHSGDDLAMLRSGQVVLSMMEPLAQPEFIENAAKKGADLLALEMVPRITRAQSMDVLSSMATVAGYQAVLIAATHLPKFFPMFMTAAGTIKAAKCFVIGAGVAGLQAIATARRLGAVVYAYDTRPVVKEQVESLGGKFVEIEMKTEDAQDSGGYAKAQSEEFYRLQREKMAEVISDCDVVITTAAVPGKKAPVLVTRSMVEKMKPGSVIVDLAAEKSGNCELTQPGKTVVEHGVTIIGPINLPASLPVDASQMFSKNAQTLLEHLIKDGAMTWNMEDEITVGTVVARGGKVVHPAVLKALSQES